MRAIKNGGVSVPVKGKLYETLDKAQLAALARSSFRPREGEVV